MWKRFIFYSTILLYVSACDCVFEVKGIVLDKDTYKPIPDVTIKNKKYAYTETAYTDSTGFFEYVEISSAGNCSDRRLNFQKDGYQDSEIDYSITLSGDTIFLAKR